MPTTSRARAILTFGAIALLGACLDNRSIPRPDFPSGAETIVLAQPCEDAPWVYAESVDAYDPPPVLCRSGGTPTAVFYDESPESLGLERGVLEAAHCQHEPPTLEECCIGRALPTGPSSIFEWSGTSWRPRSDPPALVVDYRYLRPCPCIDFDALLVPLPNVNEASIARLLDDRVALVTVDYRPDSDHNAMHVFDPFELAEGASGIGSAVAEWDGPDPNSGISVGSDGEVYVAFGSQVLRVSPTGTTTTGPSHPLLFDGDRPEIEVLSARRGSTSEEVFSLVTNHPDVPLIWSEGSWRSAPIEGGPTTSCLEQRNMADGQEAGRVDFAGFSYVMPRESDSTRLPESPLVAPNGTWRYAPGQAAEWIDWRLDQGECVTGIGADDAGVLVATTARRFFRLHDRQLEELPVFDQPDDVYLFEIKAIAPYRSGFIFVGSGGMFGYYADGLMCDLRAFGAPKLLRLIVVDDLIFATGEAMTGDMELEDDSLLIVRPRVP